MREVMVDIKGGTDRALIARRSLPIPATHSHGQRLCHTCDRTRSRAFSRLSASYTTRPLVSPPRTPVHYARMASSTRHRSSLAVRKKRRESRPKKGGKSGNQGLFHGGRETFLDEWYPRFLNLTGESQLVKNKYWSDLFSEYWQAFPWRLPLDKEPDAEGDWVEPTDMSEELQAEKAATIKRTKKVRVYFFPNVCTANSDSSKSKGICAIEERPACERRKALGRPSSMRSRIMKGPLHRARWPCGSFTCA